MTEDEMVGWHHQLNGHEFEQALGVVMDREARCAAVHGVTGFDMTEWLNWTELKAGAEKYRRSLKHLAVPENKEGNKMKQKDEAHQRGTRPNLRELPVAKAGTIWAIKQCSFGLEYSLEGASLIAQSVKNLPVMQDTWIWFLGQEDTLEKETATHSSILAWTIPWTGSWRAIVHEVAKSWTQLSD